MASIIKKTLAASASAPPLQLTAADGSTNSVPPPANDPKGFKTYIAWCVAYYIYPYQDGVNVKQDISNNATVNPDALTLDINYYTSKLSQQFGYTWSLVSPADVKKLKTVQDLENLIIANLS